MDCRKGKESYVHDLFRLIAHRYDLMNTLLSFNQDRYWRRFTASRTELGIGGRGIDVCCGTGKLAIELSKLAGPGGEVVGLDFCAEMLEKAKENIKRAGCGRLVRLAAGNAMQLPFADDYFDCATMGFALRNVPDIQGSLREMARVVRPGGKVVTLELSKPGHPLFKRIYYLYFHRLVPVLGKLGVGNRLPYTYLPDSLRNFPHQSEIRDIFIKAGLKDTRYFELTGGIVTVCEGTAP